METINIKAQTANSTQIEAIKAFMTALKIKFELSSENNNSPYNQEFVNKIKQGDEDIKNGKGTSISVAELDNLWK